MNTEPRNLWKLTIAPQGKTDPAANSFDFCKAKGIVGIGWSIQAKSASKKEASEKFDDVHGRGKGPFNAMLQRIGVGDHVWVYGGREYHVCRVDSDWMHGMGGDWDRCDIHNYRRATWQSVAAQFVPGAVKRSLTMRGTLQAIGSDAHLRRFSGWLFENPLSANRIGELERNLNYEALRRQLAGRTPQELFAVLDADETEDVVGLYLQSLGWRMVKSSAYRSQRDVECEFVRAGEVGVETAYMQVKSGSVQLSLADYRRYAESGAFVYLFSTAPTSPYLDAADHSHERLLPLEHDVIAGFVHSTLTNLPIPILLKLAVWVNVL